MPGSTLVLCDSRFNVNGIFMEATTPLDEAARRSLTERGYNALSARWRALFGRGARKVPLDAGFSCPNRDGTLGVDGCAFCNARGSGTGLSALSLTEQWTLWRSRRLAKWGQVALVAYLQAFSNTYGPARKLARVLDELAGLEGLEGLCLGTRPDCLDREKTRLLADFPARELWLELGLQSANPATLARINRGHGPESFARAAELAASFGINICAHLIIGLPGETVDDFLRSLSFMNALPVAGVKFHNLFVPRGSTLERDYHCGSLTLLSREDYVEWLILGLTHLRPDVVVHRLNADPDQGELVAPDWAGQKRQVLNAISAALARPGVRQGSALSLPGAPGAPGDAAPAPCDAGQHPARRPGRGASATLSRPKRGAQAGGPRFPQRPNQEDS